MKKIISSNSIISLIILINTYTLEMTLSLGDFNGDVFFLYSYYGLGVQLITNICIALLYHIKKEKKLEKVFWYSSILVGVVLLVVYMGQQFFVSI